MVSISGSKGLALHLQLLLSPVASSVYFGLIWLLLWPLVTPASSLCWIFESISWLFLSFRAFFSQTHNLLHFLKVCISRMNGLSTF